MKLISSQMDAYLSGTWQTNADCVRITLKRHQPRIVDISQANPGVVTTKWPHGFQDGYNVRLVNVRGMTEVRGVNFTVTVIDALSFSIGVDTTLFTAYEIGGGDGGTARRIIGYTTYAKGLDFEGLHFSASEAFIPSEMRSTSDFSVSNFNLVGVLSQDGIKTVDVLRKVYADAELHFFKLNYKDLSMGKIWLPSGRGNFGQITLKKNSYEAEYKSMEQRYQQNIGHVYSMACRAVLGYDGQGEEDTDNINLCKMTLYPPVWQPGTHYTRRPPWDGGLGNVVRPTNPALQIFLEAQGLDFISQGAEPVWDTNIGALTFDGLGGGWVTREALVKESFVTSIPGPRFRFVDYGRGEPEHWYRYGKVTWLSGANMGMTFEVRQFRRTDYAIVAVSVGAQMFSVAGNQLGFFSVGGTFPVTGSAGNDTTFPIAGVDTKAKTFQIVGNLETFFPAGSSFVIIDSIINNGSYVVDDADYDGVSNRTTIKVTSDLPGANIDGSIVKEYTIAAIAYNAALDRTELTVLEVVRSSNVSGVLGGQPLYFEFYEDTPWDIQPGDRYEMTAGCDGTLQACRDKFRNTYNRRAEDFVPGTKVYRTPDSKL